MMNSPTRFPAAKALFFPASRRVGGIAGFCVAIFAVAGTGHAEDAVVFFENKIRPVLAEQCVKCHGPEAQKASLRVDSRDALLRGSDGGPAVTPGNPGESRLLSALRGEHGIELMPKGKDPLTDAQIADFTQWIADGAAWGAQTASADTPMDQAASHWAYEPVQKPETPEGVNPVDFLLEQKRAEKGVTVSERAAPVDLIRRLSFTLRGLPPSVEEVAEFTADPSDAKFAQFVDRWLESEEYGERWGRHWLDLARYSDTTGYMAGTTSNLLPYAYGYRDWVIEAIRNDVPYDRFVTLQLAADMLPEAERRQEDLAALGFITTGPRLGHEDTIDDRIDMVTRGLLATTVACARCHDHKFDPVSAKDYYALYGVFDSSFEPGIPDMPIVKEAPEGEARTAYEKSKGDAENAVRAHLDSLVAHHRKAETITYYLLTAWRLRTEPGEAVERDIDKANERVKAAQRWKDSLNPRWDNEKDGLFGALRRLFEVEDSKVEATAKSWKEAAPEGFDAEIAQELATNPPRSREEASARYAGWMAEAAAGRKDGIPGKFEDFIRNANTPASLPPERMREVFHRIDSEENNRLRAESTKTDSMEGAPLRAMVLQDRPEPRTPRVFLRGNSGRPGPEVKRRFLELLGGKEFEHGSGRLELAQEITRHDNPLTARTLVNRVWGLHFGRNLVSSASDFGINTPAPVQGPLLDYLAAWFLENGEQLKPLHRLLLTSEAWKQKSAERPDQLALDPENDLYWRVIPRRMDFETMRDSLLAVSGGFSRRGGPPVDLLSGDSWNRRAVYGFIDRYKLPPWLAVFDFPNPNQHSPGRFETTVPQQALFFLNSPFVMDQARRLADAVRGVDDPVRGMFERVYQRAPEAGEAEEARGLISELTSLPPEGWQAGMLRPGEGGMVFQEFKVFAKDRWSPEAEFPQRDERGYVSLNRGGGHPGNGNVAAAAAWVVPEDGEWVIELTGKVENAGSNGIRLMLGVDGARELLSVRAPGSGTISKTLRAAKGSRLVAAVGNNGSPTNDSFGWKIRIRKAGSPGWETEWEKDFPSQAPADPLVVLAHALLSSNEFLFAR